MLRQLKLKNFRKHEDRTFTFGEGLTALRGANEIGKSTVTESILYALFGSSALRDSLAETVTWGHKETELRVELTLEVEGQLYNFQRGKSGAEAHCPGGIVTGQREVSNFASEVLGADMSTVTKLMFANQNSLRGALEEGPKAVSQYIENLSDFDLFNRILDAAQTKLVTGSATAAESRVAEAELALAQAEPTQPNLAIYQAEVKLNESAILKLTVQVDSVTDQANEAEADLKSAQTIQRMHEMLEKNLAKARDDLAVHGEQKKQADVVASAPVDEGAIQAARKAISDASEASTRVSTYKDLQKLNLGYPDAFWEGSKDSFESSLASAEGDVVRIDTDLAAINQNVFEARQNVKDLQDKVHDSTTCKTCGQDLKDKAKIEAHNKVIRIEIEAAELMAGTLSAGRETAKSQLSVARSGLTDLRDVGLTASRFEKFAMQHGEVLTVDFGQHPPKLEWKGGIPLEGGDRGKLQGTLAKLEEDKVKVERAISRSAALSDSITDDQDRLAELEKQVSECPRIEGIESLKDTSRSLGNNLINLKHERDCHSHRIAELQVEINQAEIDYRIALSRRVEAGVKLERTKSDLEELVFNNDLLKKIRAARPLIADKLWNSTLSSASVMFSQMRGQASVVTKDASGFRVNGAPASSLSGSTLDILGLSLRTTLTKIFLPHTSFLVLDEPTHGMDSERTASTLGFLASSGFSQVLLISHHEATESVADHLITL